MKYLKLFEGFNTDEYYIKIDQSDFNDQSIAYTLTLVSLWSRRQ